MTVGFSGMIHHRQPCEIRPPDGIALDRGSIRDFPQFAEAPGYRRLLAAAAQGKRPDKRLWTRAAQLTGSRGNTTSLVGATRQMAGAPLDDHDLGVTMFLIRGFDPLEGAIEHGRHPLPLTKELIAQRRAAQEAA